MALLNRWNVAALAVAGFAVAAASGVMAQDKAGAVKARQDFMKAQAADTKAINDYANGMGSKEDAAKAAADLQSRAGKLPGLFTPGTSTTDMPGVSFAKPAAFTDTAKIQEISAAMKAAVDKTAAAISTGTPADVKTAAGDIGKNGCGACHATYRERKPA